MVHHSRLPHVKNLLLLINVTGGFQTQLDTCHVFCKKKISWLSPLEMLTYWLYDWNAEKELFKLQVSLRETTQLFTGFLCVQN